MWWGNATGKVGNTVLSVLNGQQITRAYQPNVTNPKTPSQMAQRAAFSCPVVFYKHGIQNLFKFAYSDKKQRESDFNAFMRENAKKGVLMTREQFLNPFCPKVGNYRLSSGVLPSPSVSDFAYDGAVKLLVSVTEADIVGDEGEDMTVGTFSKAILRNFPQLVNGDIYTMLYLSTDAEFLDSIPYIEPGTKEPTWEIFQLRLDVASTTKLDLEFFMVANAPSDSIDLISRDGLSAVGIIMSRVVPGGLLVSTSDLHNANGVKSVIEHMSVQGGGHDYEWYKQVIDSWGAAEPAILEGSLIR